MTEGAVPPMLLRLSLPMMGGIFATIGSSVVETWLLGRLGPSSLAAGTFVNPIVMIVISLAIGLGAGTSAVVARAIGAAERDVGGLVADALLLTALVGIAAALVGEAALPALLRLLGAAPEVASLSESYLRIWLPAAVLFTTGMVGLSATRAAGDARFQGVAMAGMAALAALLIPLLVLGFDLGIRGAAIGNAVAWIPLATASLWRLRQLGLLSPDRPSPARFVRSARRVLHIGLPAAATNAIIPISTGILVGILAQYGDRAVAGYGVGARFEGLALVPFYALSAVMNPFTGQNAGAGRLDRVRTGLRAAAVGCLAGGAAVAALLWLAAAPIAARFTRDADVAHAAVQYMRIVPLSYGTAGVIMIANSMFNGLERPLAAVAVSVLRVLVIAVPVAWAGGKLFGVPGVFAGSCLANLLVGLLSYAWAWRSLARSDAAAGPAQARTAGPAPALLAERAGPAPAAGAE